MGAEVRCPKCGGPLHYQPILSSGAWVCGKCHWMTFQPPTREK